MARASDPLTATEIRSPLHVIAAAASGHVAVQERLAPLLDLAAAAGRQCELTICSDAVALREAASRAIEAVAADDGTIVGSGGDGSLSLLASQVVPAGVRFGIVPGGTFNLLARTHGIPEEPSAAAHAVLHGREQAVRVGEINGTLFFVNASVGLYPRVLADREEFKQRLGRHRWVAILSAFSTVARRLETLSLTLAFDGAAPMEHATPTVFVANNDLQLQRIGIEPPPHADRLVVLTSDPIGLPQAILLMLRGAIGRLGESPAMHCDSFESLRVERRSRTGRLRERFARRTARKLALDGETHHIDAPWHFRVSPMRLRLLVPQTDDAGPELSMGGQPPTTGVSSMRSRAGAEAA